MSLNISFIVLLLHYCMTVESMLRHNSPLTPLTVSLSYTSHALTVSLSHFLTPLTLSLSHTSHSLTLSLYHCLTPLTLSLSHCLTPLTLSLSHFLTLLHAELFESCGEAALDTIAGPLWGSGDSCSHHDLFFGFSGFDFTCYKLK